MLAALRQALLAELPGDGASIGNLRLRERIAARLRVDVAEVDYFAVRDALVQEGLLATGKGRGGSVHRVLAQAAPLVLEAQQKPAGADAPEPRQAAMTLAQARRAKAAVKPARAGGDTEVIAYRHDQTRKNNPDVGVVTPETDPDQPQTRWAYDPHIGPALQFDMGRAQIEALIDDALAADTTQAAAWQAEILDVLEQAMASEDLPSIHHLVAGLRKRVEGVPTAPAHAALVTFKRMAAPYLNWAGKAERTRFEVDTVSLHVHERIDPASILAAVRKRMQEGKGTGGTQADMFRAWFEDPLPYREAIEFYKHERDWSNRLVAGDSLLVMNSLLQKEGMAGQVQMIYIDPPYGIKYGSNFQPFVNKRDVKDRKDEDLTQEPEMIKAFRDTWELGIHSYLTYLRDRLLLAKELLHESGSVFVQISEDNVQFVRNMLDELFGVENFVAQIAFTTTTSEKTNRIAGICDYLIWYGKKQENLKFNPLYTEKELGGDGGSKYRSFMRPNGQVLPASLIDNIEREKGKVFRLDTITSQRPGGKYLVTLHGKEFNSEPGYWKPAESGFLRLIKAGRVRLEGKRPAYVRCFNDFTGYRITNVWNDLSGIQSRTDAKVYAVQTPVTPIERCMLMSTDPSDLVLDPTCGSGTTAFVAEKWGRRWITCDTSRVAVTLAKQRLMTASYDYYELKYPHEGLHGGFIYKTVPHVTLKSIANNPEIDDIYERMHPAIERVLEALNAVLKTAGAPFKVSEGGRKGTTLDFSGSGASSALQEWEVPFDFPDDWKTEARAAFDAFHAARQAMQKKMDDSIAAHAEQETLYDQPQVSKDKLRITGPFTVEAVPFPSVLSLDETQVPAEADASVARSGESLRQHTWRDELLKTGIRGKGGQMLKFAELEALPDTRYLHCSGHLDSGERVVVSFGPEHAALEQRQVELAMREAGELFPRPKMIVFCAFTFDPEAAKDIDATKGIVALKAQMNTDLLTEDLKKARSNNQSFWLMGQPDVELRQRKDGRYEVEVHGFDYFDTTSGELRSGGKKNIAAWSLDTDYDERSLFPRQVFFPMAGAKDGWNKLKKDIKAELNEALLDKLHGTVSLPFEPGENRKVAVKIVDDRGIESLKVLPLP